MSINFNKKSQAFTLVELLIVLIIIGVLAGGLWLAFGGSDAKAQETACLGNRETIKTAWSMHNFAASSNEDLQSFIAAKYHDQISNNNAACPSGGSYSDKNGDGIVECSCPEHSGIVLDSHIYTQAEFKVLQGSDLAAKKVIMDQLRKDITSVFDSAIKIEGVKIDALSKYDTTQPNMLATVLAELLKQYNIQDFIGNDFYISTQRNADGTYSLTSIAVKSGTYAYVTYIDSGNTYSFTNQLYAQKKKDLLSSEGLLKAMYSECENVPNKVDGKEVLGWSKL